jgi:hypothetical protein
MSKIIQATCENGVVKVGSFVISEAIILSLGTAPNSSGVLIIEGGVSYFMSSSAGDLDLTLEKLISAIEKIALTVTKIGTIFTAVGAGMTGPTTAPPPTLAVDVVDLNAKVTELNALKADLEMIKGDLA